MIFQPKNLCLLLLLPFFSIFIFACKTPKLKVLQFDAKPIYPGRAEQSKYTSYTLQFINYEKSIYTNSLNILLNKDSVITPVLLNNSRGDIYAENDTVLLAFTVKNKFDPNHKFKLAYANTKTTKSKKLTKLNIKQNKPPIN